MNQYITWTQNSSVAKRYRLSFERINGFDYRYVKHDGVYYVPIHHPSWYAINKEKGCRDDPRSSQKYVILKWSSKRHSKMETVYIFCCKTEILNVERFWKLRK